MTSRLTSPARHPSVFLVTLWACVFTLWIPQAFAIIPAESASERMPLSPASLLLDLAIVNGEIIAVGERGHILKSNDEGETWRQVTTPTRATLTNVFFVDEKHGWASGHSGIILSTTDGGENWKRISETDSEVSYFDAFFSDEWNGFFVGSYGQYSMTRDAGVSLENDFINDLEPHFYSVKQSPDGTLFLAGEMGQVMRSSNQGRSWRTLNFPYEGSLFDLLCLSDDTLLAFGLRGHIFRSTNRGSRWTEVPQSEPEMLTSGIILRSGTILLSTIADKVLMSNDEGLSFHPVTVEGIDGTVAVAESQSGNRIYFCGRHGFLAADRVSLEVALIRAAANHE